MSQSKTTIKTKAVALNAKSPKELAHFYEKSIGLKLLNERDDIFTLGTPSGEELIKIYPASAPRERITGLYHLALLLPSRKDLGNILKFLLTNGVEIDGASDHGYSEALYLRDPEGNGIEIYADKDPSVWDISENGEIAGIVEPMAAEEVLSLADSENYAGVPEDTVMGHIHLHVHDLKETEDFYYHVMGLGKKFMMNDQALFMASGHYHHHLGANIWQTHLLAQAANGRQGLRETVWTANDKDFEWIKKQLTENEIPHETVDDSLVFKDPAQTQIRLVKS